MRILRCVSRLLVMIAVCTCARASTLVYDFHLNPENDIDGTFAAADIFYTSSDDMTFTYLSGSIDGLIPTSFTGQSVGSGWVYSTNYDFSLPAGSVASVYFTFQPAPSGPGVYTATNGGRGILLTSTLIGFDYVGGSLTITDPNAAAPEPGAVVLLGSGLAGIVGFIKKRRQE